MPSWDAAFLDLCTKGKIRVLKRHLVEAIVKDHEDRVVYKTVAFRTWASSTGEHYEEKTWPVRREFP